jgi:hypothetical protein
LQIVWLESQIFRIRQIASEPISRCQLSQSLHRLFDAASCDNTLRAGCQ